MRPRSLLTLAVLVATVGAACTSSGPAPTPQPAPDPSPVSRPVETPHPSADPQLLLADALLTPFGDSAAVRRMGESGDASYIPALVEFLRFPWLLNPETRDTLTSSLTTLIGQPSGTLTREQVQWDWWVDWLGRHPEVQPPAGYAAWKGRLFSSLVDPEMGAFFYDGVKTRIRLEEVVWGGVAKDGIPDLTHPPVVPAREAAYLTPFDRVFGLSFNGRHRAYPLRILNFHEMANDVLGGVPFALAD